MAYGEHHLDAYDPEIGKTRTFTADELQRARGRSTIPGYRFYSVEEADRMIAKNNCTKESHDTPPKASL